MEWISGEKQILDDLQVASGPRWKQTQLPDPMEDSIYSGPWIGSILDKN